MIPDETLIPWLQEMTVDLRERDVNHHLTSISYAGQGDPSVWNMPEIDIIQKHEYALQERAVNKDLAERVVADFTELAESAPRKPILMGEFGYSAANYWDNIEITSIHLHNGLWATTFAGRPDPHLERDARRSLHRELV
jgi:endo-1,4-beta-mannosidase